MLDDGVDDDWFVVDEQLPRGDAEHHRFVQFQRDKSGVAGVDRVGAERARRRVGAEPVHGAREELEKFQRSHRVCSDIRKGHSRQSFATGSVNCLRNPRLARGCIRQVAAPIAQNWRLADAPARRRGHRFGDAVLQFGTRARSRVRDRFSRNVAAAKQLSAE